MGGVKIRFAEVQRVTMTAKQVRETRYENAVFSLWAKKEEEEVC